jgi:hypothetical protein
MKSGFLLARRHVEVLPVPTDTPPRQLARLSRIFLFKRSFDAPVVRQIYLPPPAIIKTRIGVGDFATEVLSRPPLGFAFNKLATGGGDPRLNLLVGQLAFLAGRVAFLEPPIGIERKALARVLRLRRCD